MIVLIFQDSVHITLNSIKSNQNNPTRWENPGLWRPLCSWGSVCQGGKQPLPQRHLCLSVTSDPGPQGRTRQRQRPRKAPPDVEGAVEASDTGRSQSGRGEGTVGGETRQREAAEGPEPRNLAKSPLPATFPLKKAWRPHVTRMLSQSAPWARTQRQQAAHSDSQEGTLKLAASPTES